MKCGYYGKDFAESQHHYCPEGQRFLLDELARLRAEVEILVWNLAGISTLACSRTPTDYNREMARPALNEVAELVKDYARLRAVNAELSVTIQKLRKALTYYAEQEYHPSRAGYGVIAREALR